MSDTKFTPGEWIQTAQFNVMVGDDPVKHTFLSTQHTGGLIATVEEREANAALIAAAPDMYKALEDLVTAWHSRDDDFRMNAFDTSLEVLKKARGE